MMRTRREVLGLLGGAALVASCRDGGDEDVGPTTTTLPVDTIEPIDFGDPIGNDPFGLGVASGDPDASSVVLWTWVDRAPERDLLVEVAADEAFTAIVQRSPVDATVDTGMTGRATATGLRPDTVYWYRFAMDGHVTGPARTRTAPSAGVTPDVELTVGHLSCMRRSSGYWTALDDLAAVAPDLVVHCGDYVYESDIGGVRPDDTPPPTTLDEYRALWRKYKADASLQAAHAVAPWLMVWDDHEVANNYQGTDPNDGAPSPTFDDQRAAAYRAWWEFTPTRVAAPTGNSLPIHRTVDWGSLTRFVLLDTRQYRDDQPCGPPPGGQDVGPRCAESATVSMLGAEQESWFADVAPGHDAVWTTVVQQVVVHQWRFLGGNTLWNLDQWDGYTGARLQLLETLAAAPTPVVLTGDVHSSWVSDLRSDFDDDSSDDIGVEFVAPGVSSDVPSQLRGAGSLIELSSPHIRWSETRSRGWVLHTIGADEWTAEYRLVEDASVEGSPVAAVETFRVESGRRRLS
ncbi:MAG: alkaline phosphatase D family protein [Acidimicrobiales bacterium]|nr:alkaline phosphatase D family protein [Acidimicrobiales bacterium]